MAKVIMSTVMLDKAKIEAFIKDWMTAWNRHDLQGVLRGMADDVVFEHWNGRVVCGKNHLAQVWRPWFVAHGDFRFEVKGICVDERRQTLSFEWRLEWPSPEPSCRGQREVRAGIDYIQMREGLVVSKRSYVKTVLEIGGRCVVLKA